MQILGGMILQRQIAKILRLLPLVAAGVVHQAIAVVVDEQAFAVKNAAGKYLV